jgi:hypothetical protein
LGFSPRVGYGSCDLASRVSFDVHCPDRTEGVGDAAYDVGKCTWLRGSD